jgi:hypothetical protein
MNALLAEWPNGKVPHHLSTTVVIERIRSHYRKITQRAGVPDGEPSAGMVRRLLGREPPAKK